jgi:hypothetical protein
MPGAVSEGPHLWDQQKMATSKCQLLMLLCRGRGPGPHDALTQAVMAPLSASFGTVSVP